MPEGRGLGRDPYHEDLGAAPHPPFAGRAEPMFAYKGPTDPSRVSPVELGEEEICHRLGILTGLEADKVSLEVKVESFHQGAPLKEVNFFLVALFG